MTAKELNHINIEQTIDDGLAAIEKAMFDVTNSDVTVLRDASHHILSAGGKRIRPRLLLLSYLALGGDDFEYIAKPGAALELMHTASVVHDDINDHGIVRRGRPSVNSIWGRTFALLTGDFLFTAVYELMASYGDLNTDLSASATALVEGETLQASAVKEKNFTREVYMRIIALKTAALFKSAGSMGAKLANAKPAEIEALSNFGFNIGLAFQVIDDILDIVADEAQLGKTAGIDIEQGRGLGVALQNGGTAVKEDPMESIKRKMLEGDTIEKGREQAKQLVEMAIAGLQIIPDSPAKTELIKLAYLVIDRDH
jgi:geranylgeranyl pyrophosphate synthase